MAAKRAVPRKVGKMRLTDGDKLGKGDSGSPYALMPLSFREALNAGSLVAGITPSRNSRPSACYKRQSGSAASPIKDGRA